VTVSIIAKNQSQKRNTQIRGGTIIDIGSANVSNEQPVASGGLKAYAPPVGKTARVIGALVLTDLGTNNTRIFASVTDLGAGRTIQITQDLTVVGQRGVFDFTMLNNYFVQVGGDGGVPKDGKANWLADIQETDL